MPHGFDSQMWRWSVNHDPGNLLSLSVKAKPFLKLFLNTETSETFSGNCARALLLDPDA
jgi:hypothetical protein